MQTDINAQMRAILIDWLVEVAEEYNLMQETMYICVSFSFHSQDTEQDTEVGIGGHLGIIAHANG